MTDRESVLDFLYQRVNYERLTHVPYSLSTFKLERMRQLLARIGDPHLSLPAVHIAGTKGKGSTAAMIAAVLQASGLKTALYTSPHLERLEERFVVDGQAIGEETFVALMDELRPIVEEMDRQAASGQGGTLTFFEITTALGFLHFARSGVEIAVLEVGLGGRLDSTNVCRPEVTVITSISFDHTKQLGNTLAEIAREKAGIIKPGIPVISGVTEEEPRRVIEQVAREEQCLLLQRGRDFEVTPSRSSAALEFQAFDYRQTGALPELELLSLALQLPGDHQRANGGVAVAALQQLARQGWRISKEAIRAGLAATRCPARVQLLATTPPVVIDVAHNVASVQALVETLGQLFPGVRPTIIFATSKDKDVKGMLRILLPACSRLIVTRYVDNPRGMEVSELFALAQQVSAEDPVKASAVEIVAADHPRAAWEKNSTRQSALTCITGSFFLAAEMAQVLRSALPGVEI